MTLGRPITVFFSALAGDAAEDGDAAFKAWARRLVDARRPAGGWGSIHLEDPERTYVVVPASLPDEGFDALRVIDWDANRGRGFVWSPDRRAWTGFRQPT